MVKMDPSILEKEAGSFCLLDSFLGKRGIGPSGNEMLGIKERLAVPQQIQILLHLSTDLFIREGAASIVDEHLVYRLLAYARRQQARSENAKVVTEAGASLVGAEV